MNRIEFFELIMNLFKFKSIFDEERNEFIVFEQSRFNSISGINDKTEFEALENHVHLLEHIKKEEFERLNLIAQDLGRIVLMKLKSQYPEKNFVVYVSVTLHDSMILRFHQKWDGEQPYYNASDFSLPDEKVFAFEG